MTTHFGSGSEPVFSNDASVPYHKRNDQFEIEWYQWSRKTGLQRCSRSARFLVSYAKGRRKAMSAVWKYYEIPGLLENLPGAGKHRPYTPLIRDASGLFEDPWVRLRNEMEQQLQVVRRSYASSKV